MLTLGPVGHRHRTWGRLGQVAQTHDLLSKRDERGTGYVRNNVKDRATLRNAKGNVVDRCAYNSASASTKVC
jgi:hypothetical protein